MKQFSILTILLALFALSSCKKDKDEDPQPDPHYHLNLSTETMQAAAIAGSTANVSIEANSEWKVTIPSNVDWVTVNKTSGSSNDNIQISVTKDNTTGAKRTAAIVVSLL